MVEPLTRVFDYENDEVGALLLHRTLNDAADRCSTQEAARQELELFRLLAEGQSFSDDSFPASPYSLYFDPLHPPSGALPTETIEWLSVHKREILKCTEPQVISDPPNDSGLRVLQGSLQNREFVNALAVLATNPEYIIRLFVSRAVAPSGLYTIKLYLDGRWQYLHIDDSIPCTAAGRPCFSSCHDRNQTWCLLVEKAFAKALGCYESLCSLSFEEAVQALMGGAVMSWPLSEHPNSWEYITNNIRQAGHEVGFVRTATSPKYGVERGVLYTVKDITEAAVLPHVSRQSRSVKLLRLETRWQKTKCNDVCEVWKWNMLELPSQGLKGVRGHDIKPSAELDRNSFVLSEAELFDIFDMAFVICDSCDWASVSAGAYEGSWIPGHPTKGVAGPPTGDTFVQNPVHPLSITETSKLAVVLSRVVECATEAFGQQQQPRTIPIGWIVMKQQEEDEPYDITAPGTIVAHCSAYQNARVVSGAAFVLPGSYVVVPYCDPTADKSNYRLDVRLSQLQGISDGVNQLLAPQQTAQQLSECKTMTAAGKEVAASSTNLEPLYEQVADLATLLRTLKDSSNT